MPASVIPIRAGRQGIWVLLEAVLPDRPAQNIGVFLIDPAADRAWVRLRERFDDLADPDDAEVLEGLEGHIQACLAESGAEACLASLEDSLSNVLRVSERQTVAVDAFTRVLDRLFERARRETAGGALPDPPAALQPARRGRRLGRGDGIVGRGLGARAGRHAAFPRPLRGPRGGPLHGAAHSGWQPQSLPPASRWARARTRFC